MSAILLEQKDLFQNMGLINKNIIEIDINGTLLPEELQTSYESFFSKNEELLELLKSTISKIKNKGILIALNSDSPLPQMKKLDQYLGISGTTDNLVFAEKAKLIKYNSHEVILGEANDIVLKAIGELAKENSLCVGNEVIAPEFGGEICNFQDGYIYFGANRKVTASIRGLPKELHYIWNKIGKEFNVNDFDFSPENNFLGYIPGGSTNSKRYCNDILRALGNKILLIGNSSSDEDEKFALVGDHSIKNIIYKPQYISPYQSTAGVSEILAQVLSGKIIF